MAFAVTTDFSNGTTAVASEVNQNFEDIENEFNDSSPTPNTLKHIVPLASIIAWAKYFTVVDSGQATSTTSGKLVQTGQNFEATVTIGDLVSNTTDGTTALVTNVDSDTTLSIDTNIMASGEDFIIYTPQTLDDSWVECNGQALSDADSDFNGQTIPDLNASSGTARFLRGSQTCHALGGSETHTHGQNFADGGDSGGDGIAVGRPNEQPASTDATSTLPSYFEIVWIMRIK